MLLTEIPTLTGWLSGLLAQSMQGFPEEGYAQTEKGEEV